MQNKRTLIYSSGQVVEVEVYPGEHQAHTAYRITQKLLRAKELEGRPENVAVHCENYINYPIFKLTYEDVVNVSTNFPEEESVYYLDED